ncbi:MAG: YhjD/YihY/BrkB family envelope integrity protein [Limisphaerales bacterium]
MRIFFKTIKRIRVPVDFARRFVSVRLAMVKNPFLRLVEILTGISTGAENELNRLERFAHFCVLVGKSFIRNRCLIRASALSYTTLLAMIPLLAVAVSVTSSLLKTQGEKQIYAAIDKLVSNIMPPATLGTNGDSVSLNLSPISVALTPTNSIAATNSIASATNNPVGGTPVVSVSAQKEVAKDIHNFVQKTQSKALGGIGMLLLVVVAIRMLANVEATFNDIWGVTRGRNWLWRIVLYWTAITLGPLAIIGALGLAGGTHLQSAKHFVEHTPFIGSLIFQFLPLVVLWLAFALLYQLVPNTKVHFSAALTGGIVAGSLWHLNNMFGFLYVSRVVSNSKIYGSLGLVPVFMIGLYFSWAILLFGAQVAYAFQNRKAYLQEKLVENVNQRGREFIALRLMTCISRHFQTGRPPVTLQKISVDLGIPTKLAQQVLQTLLAARLIVEITGSGNGYAPARPLETINCHDILAAMRAANGQEIATRDEPMRAEVFGEFAKIQEAEKNAAASVTMLALVNRASAQLEIAAPSKIEK